MMKGPRLTRSKTRRHDPAAQATPEQDSRASGALPFKTSLDELRSPDGRQRLREQLSSAFPDSYAASVTESSPYSNAASMAGTSSTSSVDTHGKGQVPKRLSTLPEQNPAIDVEQAIHLLTELKKTATPEQLVALHKALLPTRDSMISMADSSAGQGHGQRASLIRQKSMLPPGLATRGGAADDPLKRQEDLQPVRKRTARSVERHHRVRSDDRIAALDLADDAATSKPTHRAVTPNDEHYFGAFRPGTLRITNGAASPEPSLRPKPSVEALTLATSDEQVAIGRARAESLAKAESKARDKRDVTDEMPKKRAQTFHGQEARPLFGRQRDVSYTREPSPEVADSKSPSITPLARSREPSLTRLPKSIDIPQTSPPITPLARSREPSRSRTPKPIDVTHVKALGPASRRTSADTLLRRSIDSFTVRKSFDDGRVSPLDAPPRFAQRWSHRASQISQEYAAECEVPVSPFEDRQNALAFASRLSTVLDGGDAEDTTAETPAAALMALEGNAAEREEEAEERRSLRATAQNLNAVARPPLTTFHSEPRPMPRKADSGYVSDASHQSNQCDPSHEMDSRTPESSLQPRRSQTEHLESTPRVECEREAVGSQEQQAARTQVAVATNDSPGRLEATRKHSSLLKLPALMRSTPAASKTSLAPGSPASSSPQQADAGMSSPAEPKTVKPSKKLQKRMPEELRKQRRELREKEKQKQLSLSNPDGNGDGPASSAEMVSSPLPISEPPTPSALAPRASPLATRSAGAPVELAGDFPQSAAELDSGELPTIPKRSTSRKSRRRSRTNTVVAASATDTEDTSDQKQRKRSFSLGRKRSKSKRRSGSATPKRKSKDVPAVPSIAALSAMWDENGSHDSLPLHSDHSSVSRTLGSNPYDISTELFSKGNSSRPLQDEVQSPHQISSSLSRSRNGGLQGMDSSMASELARMKSRDVAMLNNEDLFDRPRMATPRKRSQQDTPSVRNSLPNSPASEHRALGWHAKPVFHKPSFESLHQSPQARPHSIAESIPSLPELPADAEARSTKAAEYLARYRNGMQASPVLAESPSPAASPAPSATEHPGFSNESVADAVAKAIEARKAKRAELIKQGQQADRLRPLGPRMNSSSSSSSGKVSLQLHTPSSPAPRPNSDASASILIGVGSDRDDQESRPNSVQRPATASEQPSVWERQAQLWRQKRESATMSAKKPEQDGTAAQAASPVKPPSPAEPPHSAPPGRETFQATCSRRKSAVEHADFYRELIGNVDDDATPATSPDPASTPLVDIGTGRSTPDTAVAGTAQLAKAYQAPLVRAHASPGGRVRTPSGSYVPYAPLHAEAAERSRASYLAQQLEGKPRATQSLDMPRPPPHHQQHRSPFQHRNDTLESLVSGYRRALSPVPASEAGSLEQQQQQQTPQQTKGVGPLIDRYGGGLQYGYQKGVGVQGSSGLRSSVAAPSPSPRGGNPFSEQFGLDLGDVPVFLSRAG